jgi:hypothetical protein
MLQNSLKQIFGAHYCEEMVEMIEVNMSSPIFGAHIENTCKISKLKRMPTWALCHHQYINVASSSCCTPTLHAGQIHVGQRSNQQPSKEQCKPMAQCPIQCTTCISTRSKLTKCCWPSCSSCNPQTAGAHVNQQGAAGAHPPESTGQQRSRV